MKLKITFAQQDTASTATVLNGEIILTRPTSEASTYTIAYDLTEGCTTTNKFINLYKESLEDPFQCSYNIYKSHTNAEGIFDMKTKMNSIIETNNTIDQLPNIDKSLILDIMSSDTEMAKLNTLHLYFEDESNKIKESEKPFQEEIYQLLEGINSLVHSIEGGLEVDRFFSSLRLSAPAKPSVTSPLTAEDYNNFSYYKQWGDLRLDYYRVGKDLNNCYHTNDTELVTSKGVAQQDTVHTCINLDLTTQEATETETDRYVESYYKWCDVNNVRDYYDIDLPMFNLGRIVLGKINTGGTTQDEIMTELHKCTSIIYVELIDE